MCTPLIFFITGKTETLTDKLRSILAQLEYQYQIATWEKEGVDFRTYLYVPEKHPLTQDIFYEREDEAHVFKVYSNSKIAYSHNTIMLTENCQSYACWW